MFAYCDNNPVMDCDPFGAMPVAFPLAYKDDSNEDLSFWESFLLHMSRQRKNGHTFSVGYACGSVWGDMGYGKSGCIAVDNSYNYALQSSDSVNVGFGTGASVGLVFTYTTADNVYDLEGSSSAYGVTVCVVFGVAIDFISFTAATDPSKKCYGISVALLCGAEFDGHASESYTTSRKSWNPFKALYDAIHSN